jgi:hypothetical protein
MSSWSEVLIVVILIIAIFYLIDYMLLTTSDRYYSKINNDNDINTANTYLSFAKHRIRRTPLENYRIGNVYDFILKKPNRAHEYYIQALQQVRNNNDEHTEFIRTRLRDRVVVDREAELDDVKYNIFNLHELDHELHNLEEILQQIYKNTESEKSSKTIEDRIKWEGDGQNVHDSNINDEIKQQYDYILDCNRDKFLWDFDDIKNYILNIYKPASEYEKNNIQPALDMLEYIRTANGNIVKLNTSEQVFVSNVFTKIYNESDEKNHQTLMENFLLNLKDSNGSWTPVCITGRVTRIMSSFAGIDDTNPNLGILKSKPVLRNEILAKAADVRNRILESCPESLQKKYNNATSDDEVQDLEKKMKQEIQHRIYMDYADIRAEDGRFIDNLLNEINASI